MLSAEMDWKTGGNGGRGNWSDEHCGIEKLQFEELFDMTGLYSKSVGAQIYIQFPANLERLENKI